MKTRDFVFVFTFAFLVALAALTGNQLYTLAAAATAVVIISHGQPSCPRRGYMPGSRLSGDVLADIHFLRRQILIWEWLLTLSVLLTIAAASVTVFLVNVQGWPGNAVNIRGLAVPQAIVAVLSLGALFLLSVAISLYCVQPLRAVLEELLHELECSVHAEENNSTVRWVSNTQQDWDSPDALRRRMEDRNRRLFGG